MKNENVFKVVFLVLISHSVVGGDISNPAPLFRAIENDDLDGVKRILDSGIPIDIKNKDQNDQTALMYASCYRNLNIVQELCDRGAQINLQDRVGHTALMYASGYGNLNIVQELCNRGAQVNLHDDDDHRTALMYAVYYGNLNIVQELLNREAQIDSKDADGKTALMHASEEGDLYIGQELISKGARVDLVNINDKTALDFAIRAKNSKLISLLRACDALQPINNPRVFSREPNLSNITQEVHEASWDDALFDDGNRSLDNFIELRQLYLHQKLHSAHEEFKEKKTIEPVVRFFMQHAYNHERDSPSSGLHEVAHCFKSDEHMLHVVRHMLSLPPYYPAQDEKLEKIDAAIKDNQKKGGCN